MSNILPSSGMDIIAGRIISNYIEADNITNTTQNKSNQICNWRDKDNLIEYIIDYNRNFYDLNSIANRNTNKQDNSIYLNFKIVLSELNYIIHTSDENYSYFDMYSTGHDIYYKLLFNKLSLFMTQFEDSIYLYFDKNKFNNIRYTILNNHYISLLNLYNQRNETHSNKLFERVNQACYYFEYFKLQ
jgi:hypothetical protein